MEDGFILGEHRWVTPTPLRLLHTRARIDFLHRQCRTCFPVPMLVPQQQQLHATSPATLHESEQTVWVPACCATMVGTRGSMIVRRV
jgi:hypothetical protein